MIGLKLIISKKRVINFLKSRSFIDDCRIVYHLECVIDFLVHRETEESLMRDGYLYTTEDVIQEAKQTVRKDMLEMGKRLSEQHKAGLSKFDLNNIKDGIN